MIERKKMIESEQARKNEERKIKERKIKGKTD